MKKPMVVSAAVAKKALGVSKVRANGTWGKYNARICADDDGNVYHSQTERDAILELRELEKRGIIRNLETQVAYNFARINLSRRSYVADAVFDVVQTFKMESTNGPVTFFSGKNYVVDIKSPATAKNPVFTLKRDLMWAVNGIRVIEVVRRYTKKKSSEAKAKVPKETKAPVKRTRKS